MMSVFPRMPVTILDNIAWGVTLRLASRMASASPGASRSMTARANAAMIQADATSPRSWRGGLRLAIESPAAYPTCHASLPRSRLVGDRRRMPFTAIPDPAETASDTVALRGQG